MKVEIASPENIGRVCGRYSAEGFRLQTMVGTDERALCGGFVLRYLFVHDQRRERVECRALVPADEPLYASATPVLPAADWYEREAYDLFGLCPAGHPDPAPLVLHGERQDIHPLRKDYPVDRPLPEVRRVPPRPALSGGAFEVPVGPIHAGVIEPGHFRFRVQGEEVEALSATLFYTHRGLEKRAEGMPLAEGIRLVEQTCGVCSVSHALSYAQAVESLADVTIPERASWIRMVLAELERLYNHVGDVGNVCAGIGFSFGSMQGGRLKERLQQLNDDIFGHRYLRKTVSVGGVTKSPPDAAWDRIRTAVQDVLREFGGLVDAALSHEIVCDRLRGTGILSADTVRRHGAVGPAARASGVLLDARADQPYASYDQTGIQIPTYPQGDVMARVEQRIAETFVSGQLLEQALDHLEALSGTSGKQPLCTPIPAIEPYRHAVGVSESARGENVHFVMAGPGGTIERLRIRSASYANWPVVPSTVPGNLIADFPLINKSFELCYACSDR